MIVKSIPFSWIADEEHRLDCGPFTRGGIEAKKLLERSSLPKNRLIDITQDGIAGMYHVGMDKLRWVAGPNYGIPFLRSSDILKADLSNQPYISHSQVKENPLFTCPVGTTLITRSGSIGRLAYCRQDMARMAISQDVLKVVPDTRQVSSGYLYAFLSSKFGVPLIVSGTFGSIIVHIEAENIAHIPVPRLGADAEREVDALVKRAGDARYEASLLLAQTQEVFRGLFPPQGEIRMRLWTQVSSLHLQPRFDAYYYSDECAAARRSFDEAASDHRMLGDVADISIPGIFKRRYADDPEFGIPYITGSDVFEICPTSERYLMKSVADRYGLTVSKGTILIQEAGQLGGLMGRSVLTGDYLDGFAVSNNMVRIIPKNKEDTGYLLGLLSTPAGVKLMGREAAGSSIPHLEVNRVRDIKIPWPKQEFGRQIGSLVMQAQEMRDLACVDEARARQLVEDAIERS